jgi:hypothetical protein
MSSPLHLPSKMEPSSLGLAPPCFYFRSCRGYAEIEKNGKSLCRCCAGRLKGSEFPLRAPSREPLYSKDRDAAVAMDMLMSVKPARHGQRRLDDEIPELSSRA